MSAIVLSIHHCFCEAIYDGKKLFEFRKSLPSRQFDTVLFCETGTGGNVTGLASAKGLYQSSVEEVWGVTSFAAGVDRDFFRQYYAEKECANVISLGDVRRFLKPIGLADLGMSHAPQSFRYVDDAKIERLRDLPTASTDPQTFRLFVCGAHGVGKTTFVNRVAGLIGYEGHSSSDLINRQIALAAERKVVSADKVASNQNALIESLRRTSWFVDGGLLDGHFVLVNERGQRQPIPLSTFSEMGLSGILALYCDEEELVSRYQQRSGNRGDLDARELAGIQEAELARAHEAADALGVSIEELKV